MKYVLSILLFVLFISLHLNIGGMFAQSYALFYVSFIGIILTLFFQKENNKIQLKNSAQLILFFLIFTLLIRLFIQGNIYGTFQPYAISACWLLFFVLTALLNTNLKIERFVFWVITISIILEITFGFTQLFGWIDSGNQYFRLSGSLGNPSAFSAYLSIVSPLILSVLLTYKRIKKSENLYYLLIACFIFILYQLFVSASRGAWLACMAGCLLVLNDKYLILQKIKQKFNTPIKKIAVVTSVVLVVAAGGYWLYQVKADSAFGRILVWKVTANTPHKNLIWGNGIGYFEAHYGKWQADYFAINEGTEAERYVADYVIYAYNEFLETLLEQGLIGLLLLGALFYLAFRKKRNTHNPVIIGAKASLLAIIVLMFVSFPLKNIPILLYLVFCFAVIFKSKYKTSQPSYFSKLAMSVIGLLIAVAGLRNMYGYYHLQKGQRLALSNQVEKSIIKYEKAASILCNNGNMHFYYASALALAEQYEKSVIELELAQQKSSNPSIFILLGNNYKELKQYDKAEEAYITTTNMIPSKLYPKYLLAKLYLEAGDNNNAKSWAKKVVATKEKVLTTAATEIKQEMKILLQKE